MTPPTIRIGAAVDRTSGRSAFSLVEVIMAVGIVSFSMLAIIGSLSVGLNSARDSSLSLAATKINQQVRSDIGNLPFVATTDQPLSVDGLENSTYFYTLDGNKTAEVDGYFEVSFGVADPKVAGQTAKFDGGAKNVTITVTYPLEAPLANRQKIVSSVLLVKQANN